jgi:glycosyltransferase involved in cell wall biosynthesis
MRVLHVHSGNLYGGVETLLSTLARCCRLCPEMQSEFALCFEGRIAAELRAAGGAVHMVGPARARNPLQIASARRRLADIIRDHGFDAAICHMAWPLAVFGPAVRYARVPLIFWMHDAVTRHNWLNWWSALTRPDLVLCNSGFTASTLPRLFGTIRSEILYYPIPAEPVELSPADRNALRAEQNSPPGAVVILQASRMEEWKGHRLHLQALAQLHDLPGWVCWIAGGAQRPDEVKYEKSVRLLAAELGLAGRLRFLGQRADVPRLMAVADIFCQPNLGAEPFGIVFLEAMQAGLPVVTTAAGGPVEILNPSCGVLVPTGDVDALADRLRRLIADPAERHRLGAAGVRRATQFCDPRKQLRGLYAAISSALDRHPLTMPARA